MVEVVVARAVVRLETASGRVGEVGLDPTGSRVDYRPYRSSSVMSNCWLPCRPRRAMSWGIATIMIQRCAACASTPIGYWGRPDVGHTSTTSSWWRCGVFSISSVCKPLNRSMVCSRMSLSGAHKCRCKACGARSG